MKRVEGAILASVGEFVVLGGQSLRAYFLGFIGHFRAFIFSFVI